MTDKKQHMHSIVFQLFVRPYHEDIYLGRHPDDFTYKCDTTVAFQTDIPDYSFGQGKSRHEQFHDIVTHQDAFDAIQVEGSREHELYSIITPRELAKDPEHENILQAVWEKVSDKYAQTTLGNYLKNAVDFVKLANDTHDKQANQYLIDMYTGRWHTCFKANITEDAKLELTQLEYKNSEFQPVRGSNYVPKKFTI